MKKPITEINAAAAVMDSIFQQVEVHWFQIWEPVGQTLTDLGIPHGKTEFVRFNYSLAALAVNFRAAFDLFPKEQAERLFTHLQNLLRKQLGSGEGFQAVRNTMLKFVEAYNNGVLHIRNPLWDVATLLYYKIGLRNTQQTVVDESYYVPDPKMIEYLSNSMIMFAGKWELLLQRFDLTSPSGRSTDR